MSSSSSAARQQRGQARRRLRARPLAPPHAARLPLPRAYPRPQLRAELNCIAVGRTGCYMPPDSATVSIFGRRDVAAKISKVRRRAA